MAIEPTFSGQSCWMNRLLIPAKTMINPAPERIIWCYRRLQPLFSEVQSTIKNRLFLQGLSENMNDDLLWMTGIHLPGKYGWADLISWILR
jgi:hypothetical protein